MAKVNSLDAIINSPTEWIDRFPYPSASSHKYSRGHVLIIGGYPMAGASRLAARAAMRIGAGMVTIAVPPEAIDAYAAAMEYTIIRPLNIGESIADVVKQRKVSAVLVGPGLGVSDETRRRVLEVLRCEVPVVVDADALNSFAEQSATLFGSITADCVMTPHEGEFSRLFDLVGSNIERTQHAAATAKAVVVLKGSSTVIASPLGKTVVNENAPATLASAGTGDVLAGMIVGLLAQGMTSIDAASAAVWIHAEAARSFGSGLIAQDLPDLLPAVLQLLVSKETAQ